MPGNWQVCLQPKLCLLPFSWCDKYQKGWNWWGYLGQGSVNGSCLGSLIPYLSGNSRSKGVYVPGCFHVFIYSFLKGLLKTTLPVCALRANRSFDGFTSGRMESSHLLVLVFSTRIPMAWMSLDGNVCPLIPAQSSQESLSSMITLHIYSKNFCHSKQGFAYLFTIHKKKKSD